MIESSEMQVSNNRSRYSWSQAWADIRPVVTRNRTWRMLAYYDIRSKYRRTHLGPWWITATNGVMALIIGMASGKFLGADMNEYLPHFVVSVTIWNFISASFGDAGSTLINAAGLIKAINLPVIIHIMRMIQRNFIIFLHNIVIVPILWVFLPWNTSVSMLLAVFGFAIVYLFVTAGSIVISMISVRFRDIPQVVGSLLQVLFFISPIIWMPSQFKNASVVISLNPITYLLKVTRDPIMSRSVPAVDWFIAASFAVTAVFIAALIYSRYRARVVFWT
jgi:lipopolysaccharide transport system permease protein